MTLEQINYIAQTVAAFAMVGSLIYLAIQTRLAGKQTKLNTQALKAAAGFEATHSWATFNEVAMSLPDERLTLGLAAYDPSKTWEDFSEVERFFVVTCHRALIQKLEGQYFLFKYGSLDTAIWEKRRDWAAGLIKLPFFQQWWLFETTQNLWTDEFVAAIETARDTTSVVPRVTEDPADEGAQGHPAPALSKALRP